MSGKQKSGFWILIGLFWIFYGSAQAAQDAKSLVEGTCSTCHRFEGDPKSRLDLIAPDLKWGGVKYQRDWLVGFLEGKEEMIYPNGYRWDKNRQTTHHMKLDSTQSNAVADYFEANLHDTRVEKGVFKLDNLTAKEVELGAEVFRQYSCLGCHQIKEDGKKIGGPISVTLYSGGKRYNLDWLFRFALNPQDFTPHSGEYLADITPRQLRHLLGFLMVQGVDNLKYYEPWAEGPFKSGDAKHGRQVYKEYCVQCHGPQGKGDGVGALGLTDPPPAKHSELPLSDYPEDYLYNVIFYGGKSVGKSPNMPDWGLTIPPKDMADLIAYLRATFKGEEKAAEAPAAMAGGASGDCPQPRKTKNAPATFSNKKNPLKATSANIKAGEALFLKNAKPVACMQCHGKNADGQGALGKSLNPKPRNFTCVKMMADISDGQMFWIIKNGSKGTGMMPFAALKNDDVWKLIHYIRSRAK